MFKLTFALLLLVPCSQPQCTSDSCGETDSMETQMRVIMQRLDELTLKDEKQMATIEGLKTNIREQETVIQELRTTTGRLETTNAELRTTVNSLQMNIIQILMTSTDLQTTNDQLRESVSSLQVNLTQMQATLTGCSAAYFSVGANASISYNFRDTIKFGHTFTNVVPAGSTGGWDAATNMYTCPITGDYMFVVTLYKTDRDNYNDFGARLTRTSLSGADTGITYLRNHIIDLSVSGAIRFSSTMQAIVPCSEGEKVSVTTTYPCPGCRLFDNNAHMNTFTGFKL